MGSGLCMGLVQLPLQTEQQRMEMQQIRLPRLHIAPLETTRAERVRLTQRGHRYRLEMEEAKGEEDQVRFAILSVVEELDRLLGFGSSFFFDPEAYGQYNRGERTAAHLNSASHAPPFPQAREYAERVFKLCKLHQINNPKDKSMERAFLQHVREQVAAQADMQPHQIVLCRNTTEAARIAALVSGILTTHHIQRDILFTDDVHISVLLHLLLNEDPGNANCKDRYSSWPTYYARRGQRYNPFETKLGKGEFGMFRVKGRSLEEIKQELDTMLNDWVSTRCIGMIVLPHVLRATGEILPIKEICDHIRRKFAHHYGYRLGQFQEDQPFILIDGAQAEGTVPGFTLHLKQSAKDTEGIDCDAYMSSPHKTGHGDVLGLLYLRDRQKKDWTLHQPGDTTIPTSSGLRKTFAHVRAEQEDGLIPPSTAVILDGMFDPSSGILPNVPDRLDCGDCAGYLAAQHEIILRESRFGDAYTCIHRARLKELFRHELRAQARQKGVKVVLPRSPLPESPFIQSVDLPGQDGRQIAEAIAGDTFVSWIGESACIRASFGLTNTEADVRAAAERIVMACKQAR